MENYKITEQELKSLNLFSYYMQSQGCKEAHCEVYYYEDGSQIEFYDLKNWYCKRGDGSFESYESIQEVLENIINSISIEDYLEGDNYDRRGSINLFIDAKERKLEIRLDEMVQSNIESGTSWEFTEENTSLVDAYPEIITFFDMLKEKGIEQGEVTFDGGGDSGEIYNFISVSGREDEILPNKVLDYLYSLLEEFYGGWEINEGSHGDFTFYTKQKELSLSFNEHSETNEDRGKILHIDF